MPNTYAYDIIKGKLDQGIIIQLFNLAGRLSTLAVSMVIPVSCASEFSHQANDYAALSLGDIAPIYQYFTLLIVGHLSNPTGIGDLAKLSAKLSIDPTSLTHYLVRGASHDSDGIPIQNLTPEGRVKLFIEIHPQKIYEQQVMSALKKTIADISGPPITDIAELATRPVSINRQSSSGKVIRLKTQFTH